MKKRIFYILLSIILFSVPAYAEKISIKIAPIDLISTNHDEIEVGDWLPFQVINDIYVNDKLYINKESTIEGVVDFVHQNGWGGDAAEIKIKTFYVIDANGKKITIDSPLEIKNSVTMTNEIKSYLSNIVLVLGLIRGSEIFIEPDTRTFNIFLTR